MTGAGSGGTDLAGPAATPDRFARRCSEGDTGRDGDSARRVVRGHRPVRGSKPAPVA